MIASVTARGSAVEDNYVDRTNERTNQSVSQSVSQSASQRAEEHRTSHLQVQSRARTFKVTAPRRAARRWIEWCRRAQGYRASLCDARVTLTICGFRQNLHWLFDIESVDQCSSSSLPELSSFFIIGISYLSSVLR